MNLLTTQEQRFERILEPERPASGCLTIWFAFIAMLLLAPNGAWAQDNANINGTVVDSTGALVANAAISLTSPASGQVRRAVSNSAGAYSFPNIGIGTYRLTASAQGFANYTKTDIVVNVAQTLEENITLNVGSQAQTVTVQADALQVQSETSEVSTLISSEQVALLSVNGRNVTQLAALGLGVSNNLPAFGGIDALGGANGISFNGTRLQHNIYLLDGGELNDRGCGGCYMSLPSQDAIAEFQTLDSNYSPDYGIGSGATIVMVLKSGTHKYHGELYEFNRNTDYDANDYFAKAAGQPRGKFQLNEPGVNIGGPLWIPHVYNNNRNRTFFFWNEEWRRMIQGSAPLVANTIAKDNFPTSGADLVYTLPTGGSVPVVPNTTDPAKLAFYTQDGLTMGQPFLSPATGQYTIPAALIDQNAVLQLNANTFPQPNLGTSSRTYSIPAPEYVREDVVRIDHAINNKLQLMGHYLHDAVSRTYFPSMWSSDTYPTVGSVFSNPSYSAAIKLTQTYSSSLLNETAFLYAGNLINIVPIAAPGSSFVQPSGWTAKSYFPATNNAGARLPAIVLQGTPLQSEWDINYMPWTNGYETYDYRDDLSWIKGRHQFKFGFGYLHGYKRQPQQADTQGVFTFNSSSFSQDSYVNFLLGDAASWNQLESLNSLHYIDNTFSFYANDNWHIIPRLTLNLGLRYDAMPHTVEKYNRVSNFVPADYTTPTVNPVQADGTLDPASLTSVNGGQFYLNGVLEAGTNGVSGGLVKNKYNTVEPRLGFAYDVFGDGKTVLRGGVGLFFERLFGNDIYNNDTNPPNSYQPSANNVTFSNPSISALTGAVTTTPTYPSNLSELKTAYPPPGTMEYSIGVQRQIVPSVVAVIQYVGTNGWDQNNYRSINTLPLSDSSGLLDREGVANGSLNANYYRIYPGFSAIDQSENETNSNYNSFQAGIRFEAKHGLTTQLAYTWSHEIDEVSSDLGQLSNPFNAKYDRGSGAMDRRHIFNASYVYA